MPSEAAKAMFVEKTAAAATNLRPRTRDVSPSITTMYAVDATLCPDGLPHEPKVPTPRLQP